MNQWIEALHNQALTQHERPDLDTSPPLTPRIIQEVKPANFKVPQLDPYDGLGDPLDHL